MINVVCFDEQLDVTLNMTLVEDRKLHCREPSPRSHCPLLLMQFFVLHGNERGNCKATGVMQMILQ